MQGAEWDGRRRLERVVLEAALAIDAEGNQRYVDGEPVAPDVAKAQWALKTFHYKHYDATAIMAAESLRLQREANLAALSEPQMQDLFIEMLRSSPELKKKALEALGGDDADRIQDDSVTGRDADG